MLNLSLRTRYVLLLALTSLSLMVFFAFSVFAELQKLHARISDVGEQKVRSVLIQELLNRSDRMLNNMLLPQASGKDVSGKTDEDLRQRLQLISDLPFVSRVLSYNRDLSVLYDSVPSDTAGQPVQDLLPAMLSLNGRSHLASDDRLMIHYPLSQQGTAHQGVVSVLSLEPVQRSVNEMHGLLAEGLDRARSDFLHALLVLLVIFSVLILLLSALFSYSISQPIRALMDYSEKLALGLWELPQRLRRDDEFGRLGSAFRQMAMQIQANVRSTENLAFYDQLTGIGNRTFFQQQITDLLEDRHAPDFVILQAGLDNFKWFNETRGHNAGDELLRQVVSGMLVSVNAWCQQWAFSREHIGVYRLGGDEFGVIAQGELSRHSIQALAQSLMDILDSDDLAPRRISGIQASIGVVQRPRDATVAPATLQTQAAIALNEAKKQGRNRIVYYASALDQRLKRRYRVEQALLTARQQQELFMVYQPQISLETGETVGFEALMRWQHPELGFVSPGEFFPVAEQMSVIKSLGEFVIEQVMRDIPHLTEHYGAHIKVSLNVSAAQFYYHDVAGMIIRAMRELQIHPHQIGVELTETSLLQKDQVVVEQLQRMRDAGLNILLDDFGTGYASLNYLKEFPITGLKLDRSYTARLCSGEHADFALFESLLYLAKNLGLSTVVEGIENEHEESQARRAGADLAQGFKYAAGQRLELLIQPESLPEPILN